MKTALIKDTFREIKKTFGRFASIFGIALVGVAFLTGVKASSPYMKKSADAYFDRTDFMDMKILSPKGFSEEEVQKISKVEGINKVQGINSMEAIAEIESSEVVFQIFSYDFSNEENNINKVNLTEGRMPEKPGECVIRDYAIGSDPVEIGTEITLYSGTEIDIGYMLSETTYTVVGKVSTPYYLSYQYDSTSVGSGKIGQIMYVNPDSFLAPVYSAVYATVDGAQEENCYKDEYFEIVTPVKERIEEFGYYALDRNSHFSYVDYGNCGDRMDAIAKVFPVFFYLVAALVCLTTMTRMVDEQRGGIGTLKALGYSKLSIAMKYIVYALTASLSGGIVGCFFGINTLPRIIFNAWNIVYTVDGLVVEPQIALCIIAVLIAVAVTVATTLIVCVGELRETPALLLRPKSPKNGKKIFLEHIPFIWKRFSFTRKVTARNIFRYKKRFFMTIMGIAGCTALILAGFGIKNSVSKITAGQYGEIFSYDVMGNFGEKCDLESFSKEYPDMYMISLLPGNAYKTEAPDSANKKINLICVDDVDRYDEYINLTTEDGGKSVSVPDEGALITYKLAKDFGVSKGDYIYVNLDGETYGKVKVADVVTMYVGQYVFMSEEYFREVYKSECIINSFVGNLNGMSIKEQEAYGTEMMNNYDIVGITYYDAVSANFGETISSLSIITIVMIISACMLAFVVLYNLITVNISERIREIATIKVLGFYDNEVASYVYRENVVLSIIGSLAGLLLGKVLHGYIMNVIEMDDVIFPKIIFGQSYVFAVLITVVFGILVNYSMYRKLKNIPMVESLKSVE